MPPSGPEAVRSLPPPNYPRFPNIPDLVHDDENEKHLQALLPALQKHKCLQYPMVKPKRSPWVRAFVDLYHPAGPWGPFSNALKITSTSRYNFKRSKVQNIYQHLQQYKGTSKTHLELRHALTDYFNKEEYYEAYMKACETICLQEVNKAVAADRAPIPTTATAVAHPSGESIPESNNDSDDNNNNNDNDTTTAAPARTTADPIAATTNTPTTASSTSSGSKSSVLFNEIESMRIGEIKQELQSYGISTALFLERSEFVHALVEARAADKLARSTPENNGTTPTTSSRLRRSSRLSSRGKSAGGGDKQSRDEMAKSPPQQKDNPVGGADDASYVERATVDHPTNSRSSAGQKRKFDDGVAMREEEDLAHHDNLGRPTKRQFRGHSKDNHDCGSAVATSWDDQKRTSTGPTLHQNADASATGNDDSSRCNPGAPAVPVTPSPISQQPESLTPDSVPSFNTTDVTPIPPPPAVPQNAAATNEEATAGDTADASNNEAKIQETRNRLTALLAKRRKDLEHPEDDPTCQKIEKKITELDDELFELIISST